jgi:AcrR family transcriptional regulator
VTRTALLRAAEALLAEGGPEAVSIRRVSTAAGTSARAVYSLFGRKDGLRSALYQAAFSDLRERMGAVAETDDPADHLVRLGIEAFRAHAVAHPHLFRLAFEWPGRRTHTTPNDRRAALEVFEMLVACIGRVAGGRLDAAALRRRAFGFHALCQGLASGELAGTIAPGLDTQALWREALESYVRGIVPGGAASVAAR